MGNLIWRSFGVWWFARAAGEVFIFKSKMERKTRMEGFFDMQTTSLVDSKGKEQWKAAGSHLNVMMYLVERAQADFRVMRDALALEKAGFEVTIVDVERDHRVPAQEDVDGIHFKHLKMPYWYISSRFKPWFL